MKKVFLTAAIIASLGIASVSVAQAQTQTPAQMEQKVEAYVKIEASALPEAVKTVVAKEYAGSTIKEAFENKEAKLYKVTVTAADAKEVTVIYNEKGEAQK